MKPRPTDPIEPPPQATISLALFDAVIDCLYEYDLGQELPPHWPLSVRAMITAARNRIMARHRKESIL
jgi:hypothetical protein